MRDQKEQSQTETCVNSRIFNLPAVLLEFPVSVIQRTNLSGFEPARYAVEVECMVANPPGYCALLSC
jgi:hypothetical protein